MGFTLVELLVASSVLVLLLGLLMSATDSASSTVSYATKKIEAFASTRGVFDIVTQKLSIATLNTYWDYYDGNGNRRTSTNSDTFVPKTYGRASDLQFLVRQNTQNGNYGQEVFFQTPEAFSASADYQSTQGLLNACGFFVRYGSNSSFRPNIMSQASASTSLRWRYRLMQALEPTEKFSVFQSAPSDNTAWADSIGNNDQTDPSDSSKPLVKPLGDNIIALIVWPRLSAGENPDGTTLTTDYTYDSQKSPAGASKPITFNQLPPTVQITMVIIDEASASRIDTHSSVAPTAIEDALKDKFRKVNQYQQDLNDLESALVDKHINYQILNTSVVLLESKWSQ